MPASNDRSEQFSNLFIRNTIPFQMKSYPPDACKQFLTALLIKLQISFLGFFIDLFISNPGRGLFQVLAEQCQKYWLFSQVWEKLIGRFNPPGFVPIISDAVDQTAHTRERYLIFIYFIIFIPIFWPLEHYLSHWIDNSIALHTIPLIYKFSFHGFKCTNGLS